MSSDEVFVEVVVEECGVVVGVVFIVGVGEVVVGVGVG